MKQRFNESDLPVANQKSQKLPRDESSEDGGDENEEGEEEEEETEPNQAGKYVDISDHEESLDPKSIEAVKAAFEGRMALRKSVKFHFSPINRLDIKT